MNQIRRSHERGFADLGWLQSRHSFSFASYFDPQFVQYGPLRVINEDWIAPGTGFGMHGHRDMEILTYVLDGAITHRDSMGNESVVRSGEVQRMSAGSGVMHSEHNRESVQTHMLQIWITPHAPGGAPSYQEGALDRKATRGAFQLVASPDEGAGAVRIGQDVRVWAGCFDGVERAELQIADGRRVYVHAARGESYINGQPLGAGDALMSTGANRITVQAGRESELLVFDLP